MNYENFVYDARNNVAKTHPRLIVVFIQVLSYLQFGGYGEGGL